MTGVDTLVTISVLGFYFLPKHSVMHEVVNGLEQCDRNEHLNYETGKSPNSQPQQHDRPQHDRDEPGADVVIADPQWMFFASNYSIRFKGPEPFEGTENFSRPITINFFTQATNCMILKCCNPDRVTAIMFDEKVTIESLGQGNL